jgi:5'-nucleotidase
MYHKIEHRKNIILLGDSLGDSNMAQEFDYNAILKIGFLNMNTEENLEKYKEHYDVILTNDSSTEFILNLLNEF